jgi:hypothetical protein
VYLWKNITGLPDKKQASCVLLSSFGDDRESVKAKLINELKSDGLFVDNSLAILIGHLDQIYLADNLSEAFESFVKFEHYKRGDSSMHDYILQFETLYNACSN